MTSPTNTELEIAHAGVRAVVRPNDGHPEAYLFIYLGGAKYFLGVRTPGMTRGDVRRMAMVWIREHA